MDESYNNIINMNLIITQNGVLNYTEENIRQAKSNHTVYEVIRIVDGIALFLEDHFERLISSVQIQGLQLEMELSEFRQHIIVLTKLNEQQNGNVKFTLSKVGKVNHWLFSFIPHSYPTSNDYQKGVPIGLLIVERENPNAKVIQNKVRDKANQLIEANQLHEVLLVDRNGMITEGSRSNVFFVKDNLFYTAPASMVLVGVTRKKVLECLSELNFKVIEEAVSASEIGNFDAVFLTGTSPKVLPVNRIDSISFPTNNSFVEQLMEKYNLMIETYLKVHRT
jgi:branched-chain amino acid aminotransferase